MFLVGLFTASLAQIRWVRRLPLVRKALWFLNRPALHAATADDTIRSLAREVLFEKMTSILDAQIERRLREGESPEAMLDLERAFETPEMREITAAIGLTPEEIKEWIGDRVFLAQHRIRQEEERDG